jgi:hypothetical protein
VAGLSFAINFAISGLEIWSYHLFKLLIHLVAGLALFGIVAITLRKTGFKHSASLALVISQIWLVHPLQTEVVTYITQRYESRTQPTIHDVGCAVRTQPTIHDVGCAARIQPTSHYCLGL